MDLKNEERTDLLFIHAINKKLSIYYVLGIMYTKSYIILESTLVRITDLK